MHVLVLHSTGTGTAVATAAWHSAVDNRQQIKSSERVETGWGAHLGVCAMCNVQCAMCIYVHVQCACTAVTTAGAEEELS